MHKLHTQPNIQFMYIFFSMKIMIFTLAASEIKNWFVYILGCPSAAMQYRTVQPHLKSTRALGCYHDTCCCCCYHCHHQNHTHCCNVAVQSMLLAGADCHAGYKEKIKLTVNMTCIKRKSSKNSYLNPNNLNIVTMSFCEKKVNMVLNTDSV